jgi:hypothetical protein
MKATTPNSRVAQEKAADARTVGRPPGVFGTDVTGRPSTGHAGTSGSRDQTTPKDDENFVKTLLLLMYSPDSVHIDAQPVFSDSKGACSKRDGPFRQVLRQLLRCRTQGL